MPIDTTDIERLAQILERSGIASIEIEEEALSLRLVMEAAEPTAPASASTAPARPSNEGPIVAKADVAESSSPPIHRGRSLSSNPARRSKPARSSASSRLG